MHLGADNSILTAIKPGSLDTDPSRPSAAMSQFVLCLRDIIAQNAGTEKPTLVLNGDILEMALSDTNRAAMVFERFIELIFPQDGEPLFNKNILYFPGNHDHHLWESARETQYADFISRIQPGAELPAPWHTTKMFAPDMVYERFLTNLLYRYPHLKDATVNIVYPNYALVNNSGQKCIILSHGHYVEAIYSLMSMLNTMFFPNRTKPHAIWDLEAENFAWIDFFFSTIGRSGDVGQDIGIIYAKLQDRQQVKKLLTNFITSYLEEKKRSKFVEEIELRILELLEDVIVNKITPPLEKQRPENILSPDARLGLQWFVEGPLLGQILFENQQTIPADIAFLFGHTHKPFQEVMSFVGYPASLKVYNSGGWVVDTLQISPYHGAAAILIDEALDIVTLRMYNQALSVGDYAVQIEEVTRPGVANSAFYEHINACVNPARDPWKTFSEVAAEAVILHGQLLQAKIKE
jgi:hypothetical protein